MKMNSSEPLLADQASKRVDIYEAHLHLNTAKHAKEFIRLERESN
jgi:hypothetical protein